MPFYPPLARTARIEGKVSLHFIVDGDGNVSEVEASSGNELLRRAAIENVQNWKFGWQNPCACRVKKEVDFAYSLAGNWVEGDGPYVVVKWYGHAPVTRVEIQVGSPLVQP
jgi:TonB family protein